MNAQLSNIIRCYCILFLRQDATVSLTKSNTIARSIYYIYGRLGLLPTVSPLKGTPKNLRVTSQRVPVPLQQKIVLGSNTLYFRSTSGAFEFFSSKIFSFLARIEGKTAGDLEHLGFGFARFEDRIGLVVWYSRAHVHIRRIGGFLATIVRFLS